MPVAPSCGGRALASSKIRPTGALPKESIVPKRQFLRMASSDFLDSRKGCLWKSSLPCIKNRRFRGAVHFGRAVWDERCAKKPGNPDGLPGSFACIRHQNCQPEPVLSCGSAALAGALFLVSGNHRQSQRHENAFSVPGCFPGAEGKCCETEAEENAGLKKAPLRIPKPQRAHEIEEQ